MREVTNRAAVELHWIPLGAGGHSVRFNGIVYEAVTAAVHGRPRCDIYHCALSITRPDGTYWVEMTPVPDVFGHERGVVATGPVGMRVLGRSRLFRYEIGGGATASFPTSTPPSRAPCRSPTTHSPCSASSMTSPTYR